MSQATRALQVPQVLWVLWDQQENLGRQENQDPLVLQEFLVKKAGREKQERKDHQDRWALLGKLDPLDLQDCQGSQESVASLVFL